MPYIKQEDRPRWAALVAEANKEMNADPTTTGDLNYLFTKLALEFLRAHKFNYDTLNAIGGVFSYADKEFYRRVVGVYESDKITLNGDVY